MEEVNLIESDSVALIKGRDNSLSWFPVYLDPDNNCFVKRDGAWRWRLEGFERFEKARRKKLCNTATGKMVHRKPQAEILMPYPAATRAD